MKKIKILGLVFFILSTSCSWKHDGKVVKDSKGNYFLLESNGIRNESYDLTPLPKNQIDSLTLNK